MTDHSENEPVRRILAAALTFLADDPENQARQLSTFFSEVPHRIEKYDLQHPLVEITEWVCETAWSDDSPREVVQILEEMDAVSTLMFRDEESVTRFTSVEALAEEPAWRVVRKLARDAFGKARLAVVAPALDFTDLVLAVAD